MTTINTIDELEKHLESVSTIPDLTEQLKVYVGKDLGHIVNRFLLRAYQLGLQNGPEDHKEEKDSLGGLKERLKYLGLIPDGSDVRSHNEGNSNYNDGTHIITPWTIWLDYPELTSWDDDQESPPNQGRRGIYPRGAAHPRLQENHPQLPRTHQTVEVPHQVTTINTMSIRQLYNILSATSNSKNIFYLSHAHLKLYFN